MKDLGQLNFFLGLGVQFTLGSVVLLQHRYTQDVKIGWSSGCELCLTPIEMKLKLSQTDGDLLLAHPSLYRQIVGIELFDNYST